MVSCVVRMRSPRYLSTPFFFLSGISLGWVVGEESGNFVPFSELYRAAFCTCRYKKLGIIPNLYVNFLVIPKIYTKKPGPSPAYYLKITLLF